MVAPRFNVSVKEENIQRRLKRLDKKLSEKPSASVEEIARLVRDRIKLYMPKLTGESARAIAVTKRINTQGYSEAIVGLGFLPHPEKEWGGEYFNLPLWMFTSNRAYSHFRSGDVGKMRNVVPNTRKEFRRRIVNDLKEIVR